MTTDRGVEARLPCVPGGPLSRRPAPPAPLRAPAVERGDDLDRLEVLAREATPEPWAALETALVSDNPDVPDNGDEYDFGDATIVDYSPYAEEAGTIPYAPNAAYIAAADPSTLLALIARLREAEDAMNVCARCGEEIDAELAAEEAAAAEVEPEPSRFPDLMAALEASLADAKRAQAERNRAAEEGQP